MVYLDFWFGNKNLPIVAIEGRMKGKRPRGRHRMGILESLVDGLDRHFKEKTMKREV